MTKQEEIREGINHYLTKQFICDEDREVPEDECLHEANALLAYLHSQGVVIKVEKKLPYTVLRYREIERRTEKMPDYGGGMFEENIASTQDSYTKKQILKAGFGAFEPLVSS